MAKLSIDLQEGFHDDSVIVGVDGLEPVQKDRVSTRRQTGLAAHLELEVPDGPVQLRIEVPTRGLVLTQGLELTQKLFVGVSINSAKKLELRVQQNEFWYA